MNTTPDDPQPQLPLFGSYRTIRRLGKGGFANVYLVESQPHLLYALKQIKQEHIDSDPAKFHERFEREVRLQARLDHPHVVKIIDYNVQQSYLVMEYAKGGTLRAFLDDEFPDGVDLQTALAILTEIGSALTYLHEKIDPQDEQHRGIVHLDLKPQNILIQIEPDPTDPKGGSRRRFLVADFSMAHQLSHTGKPQGGTSLIDGTPRYMAPEQADSEKFDKPPGSRCDIYSLGVILHEMLSGKRPPLGKRPLPLRELKKTIPLEVDTVVQRAIAEDPEERYGSVKGFVRAFTQAVTNASSSIPQSDEVSQQNRDRGQTDLPDQAPPILPLPPKGTQNGTQIPWWKTFWGGAFLATLVLILLAGGSSVITWWLIHQSLPPPPIYQLCIGTDLATSGNDSSVGLLEQNGANLAISQHANLDQGYTLTSCNKDDVSQITGIHDPAQGVLNVTAFVNDPRVVGIVGPGNSNVAEAEIPIITSAGLAMISSRTTALCLTLRQYCVHPDQVHPPSRPNAFFRIPPNDSRQGQAGADLMYKHLGMHSACVVDDQEAYGKGLADSFSTNFQKDGGNVLGDRLHMAADNTPAQLAQVAQACVSLKVNAVFYGGTNSNGGGQLKQQLASAGFSGPFVSGDGIAGDSQFLQDAGRAANNTYATSLGPDPSTFATTPFASAYKASYGGVSPELRSAGAYDAAMMLIAAIQSAIKTNPVNLASLRSTVLEKVAHPDQPYNGVTGTITFDSNGDNTARKILTVYAVENGSWVYKPDYDVSI